MKLVKKIEVPEPATVSVEARSYPIVASNEHLAALLRTLADELEAEDKTLLSLYVGSDPDERCGWCIDVVIEDA